MQNNEPADLAPGNPPSAQQARGDFDLRRKSKKPKPVKIWAAMALLFLFFILAVVGIWTFAISEMKQGSTDIDESKVVADATLNNQPTTDRGMKELKEDKLREIEENKRKAAEEAAKLEEKKQEPEPSKSNKPNGAPNRGASGNAPAPPSEMTPEQRKLSGGVMMAANINNVAGLARGVGGTQADASSPAAPGAAGGPAAYPPGGPESAALRGNGGGGGGSTSRGGLDDLSGVSFAPTTAYLAPSGKYLLGHGTYARCAVYTEIITEQPGIVDCRLTEPLYSVDGSTVIAEASARLTGVQKTAMVAGQQNVFTAWTDLDTTAGVRARLDSLGAGPMGASGTLAWIDNHYMERYAGAVALSFIQDVLKAATTPKQGNDSGGYTVNNSEQNVESMADKALNSTINIPPTGYILPGTVITVIIARDIDFSTVYENR